MMFTKIIVKSCFLLVVLVFSRFLFASGFTDITDSLNIQYQRSPSASFAIIEKTRNESLISPFPMQLLPTLPIATYGLPGVSVFDYDGDGDLDIFGTNGPGSANVLYQNQLVETGSLSFIEKAAQAGLAAVDMDANGTCYGDVDNDSDLDLLVLGRDQPNRFFENLGNGTFVFRGDSGVAGGNRTHVGCSMGDVNGDGLLDVVIGNVFSLTDLMGIMVVPYDNNQHNQLYINLGGFHFSDESAARGIENLDAFPVGAASATWAIAMVDIDEDGDVDIVFGDDQGNISTTKHDPINGVDRGFIQIFKNDGNGYFTAQALNTLPESPGPWMGLGFGDLNCDGVMDIFGSNFGDHGAATLDPNTPITLGDLSSRWLLGDGMGGYSDPHAGQGPSTAFGWGNAVFDVDNDGDSDIAYFGGMDGDLLAITDNPGILLRNKNCSANFETDLTTFGKRHLRRGVRGVAIGDLNRDGFVDIVTIANWRVPEQVPILPNNAQFMYPLDEIGGFVPIFFPVAQGTAFVWTGLDLLPGDLRIELNNADSGKKGITVRPVGSIGITSRGKANRSGIGAVVTFKPYKGKPAQMPVTAGSSHLSAHANEAYFGMGESKKGYVEILWPGGVKNRFYDVRGGENIALHELGCDIAQSWSSTEYFRCVRSELKQLLESGQINRNEYFRYFVSAVRARDDDGPDED